MWLAFATSRSRPALEAGSVRSLADEGQHGTDLHPTRSAHEVARFRVRASPNGPATPQPPAGSASGWQAVDGSSVQHRCGAWEDRRTSGPRETTAAPRRQGGPNVLCHLSPPEGGTTPASGSREVARRWPEVVREFASVLPRLCLDSSCACQGPADRSQPRAHAAHGHRRAPLEPSLTAAADRLWSHVEQEPSAEALACLREAHRRA